MSEGKRVADSCTTPDSGWLMRPAMNLLVYLPIQEVANEEAEKGEGDTKRKKREKEDKVNGSQLEEE